MKPKHKSYLHKAKKAAFVATFLCFCSLTAFNTYQIQEHQMVIIKVIDAVNFLISKVVFPDTQADAK